MKFLLISLCILVAVILLISIVAFAIIRKELKGVFGGRADRTAFTLQDKKVTDFKKLTSNEFVFLSQNETLKGSFYYSKKPDGDIIIFCHGYGAGHQAYLTEINYFVQKGFTVIGFDYRGCVNSGGTLTHFGASVEDLKACYEYLKTNFDLTDKKLYLWGHSWGAYTALCGSSFVKAEKIIALCPFNTPVQLLTKFSYPYEKGLSLILKPFRAIYLKIKFGKYANISAFKSVEKSRIPTLIILGNLDTVVPKLSYKFTTDNIKIITLKDKGHNPYNTVEAEKYLNTTLLNISQSKNLSKTLSEVDYDLITQEDLSVMELMLNFYDNKLNHFKRK